MPKTAIRPSGKSKAIAKPWRVVLAVLSALACVAASAPEANAQVVMGDSLSSHHLTGRLWRGESLVSQNGKYEFAVQSDGNIVLYQYVSGRPRACRASHTAGSGAWQLIHQMDDGNMVLYGGGGQVYFKTGAKGRPYAPYFYILIMQNDGNAVQYLAHMKSGGTGWPYQDGSGYVLDRPVWSSNTQWCGYSGYPHAYGLALPQG